MDRTARRQVWAVIAILAAFLAGALLFFFSGKWHWADTRSQRDRFSVANDDSAGKQDGFFYLRLVETDSLRISRLN